MKYQLQLFLTASVTLLLLIFVIFIAPNQLVTVYKIASASQQYTTSSTVNESVEASIPLKWLTANKIHVNLYQGHMSKLLPSIVTSSHSKELVVYTTHLYTNTNGSSYIIFLIGAGPSVYNGSKAVIGCGVNDNYGTHYKVRYNYEDIRQHNWRRFKKEKIHYYQQVIVECYGLEVKDGDKAFLVYYNSTSDKTVKVYSNESIVIPAPRKTPKEGKVSSVVCTKVLSRGVTWLPEFLRYQQTLGVDHVHVAVLDTFFKDGGFDDILANDTFFLQAVRDNFVTIQIWNEWYDAKKWEWFYYGNMFMYLDCIYRYRGTYDFVSLFDTDDFFTLRVPGLSYKEFLVKYCLRKGIGSCSFMWLFYYPGVCGFNKSMRADGNVTASMVPHNPRYEQRDHYKPTHLSKAIVDSSFHDASCSGCLQEGYRAVLIPEHIAYVAHNRLNKKLSAKRVCH